MGKRRGEAVLMSGSGSTIFCLGEPGDADTFQAGSERLGKGFWEKPKILKDPPTSRNHGLVGNFHTITGVFGEHVDSCQQDVDCGRGHSRF